MSEASDGVNDAGHAIGAGMAEGTGRMRWTGTMAAVAALTAMAACTTTGGLWPGATARVNHNALPALLAGSAEPGTAEDYGVCGAALSFDRMARAPGLVPIEDAAAETQGRLLTMTLSSPDPGLSFAIGDAVTELDLSDRRRLVERVPDCRDRYGRYFP